MKILTLKVKEIRRIKPEVFVLCFNSSYLAKKVSPGQFVHIKISSSAFLRRPFSVHRVKANDVFILFRVRGKGTEQLCRFKKGDYLDVLGPLGKGFGYRGKVKNQKSCILVAGGMGVAPLLFLADKLKKIQNSKLKIKNLMIIGAKSRKELLCKGDFIDLGYRVMVATEDGSLGFKGNTVDLLKKILNTHNSQARSEARPPRRGLTTKIYACGPTEMFREMASVLEKSPTVECEACFEQFMGCGVGICYGCAIDTKAGYKRVCKDGPVFNLREVKFIDP